jgi:hypothetical protein
VFLNTAFRRQLLIALKIEMPRFSLIVLLDKREARHALNKSLM